MTKRLVATVVLAIVVLFLSWYGYQEYKKYQTGPQVFIQATKRNNFLLERMFFCSILV